METDDARPIALNFEDSTLQKPFLGKTGQNALVIKNYGWFLLLVFVPASAGLVNS